MSYRKMIFFPLTRKPDSAVSADHSYSIIAVGEGGIPRPFKTFEDTLIP